MPLAALILAASFASPLLDGIAVEPITTFDGKRWSSLTLGALTDPDLKKQFKAGKGSVRAEGMSIPTQGSAGVKVDALMDARGAKAVLRAIRLEYDVRAPKMAEIAEFFHETPVVLYQRHRWEDWWIEALPERGIAALVDATGARPRTDVWFLASPEALKNAAARFEPEQTEIVERPDPGADWDRVVEFGDIEAMVNQDRTERIPEDLNTRGRDRLQAMIEDDLRSMRRGNVVYSRGSSGSYRFAVKLGRWTDKGEANVYFNADLNVKTPYGPLSVSNSSSKKVGDRYYSRVREGIEDLLDEMERDARAKIEKLGPPPMNAKRMEALGQFMDDLTGMRRSK